MYIPLSLILVVAVVIVAGIGEWAHRKGKEEYFYSELLSGLVGGLFVGACFLVYHVGVLVYHWIVS